MNQTENNLDYRVVRARLFRSEPNSVTATEDRLIGTALHDNKVWLRAAG